MAKKSNQGFTVYYVEHPQQPGVINGFSTEKPKKGKYVSEVVASGSDIKSSYKWKIVNKKLVERTSQEQREFAIERARRNLSPTHREALARLDNLDDEAIGALDLAGLKAAFKDMLTTLSPRRR